MFSENVLGRKREGKRERERELKERGLVAADRWGIEGWF